jgi:hypothetical protein
MDHMLSERVGKAVEETADFFAAVFGGMWMRLRNQVITAWFNAVLWRTVEVERELGIVKVSAIRQYEPCQGPETLANPVKLSLGVGKLKPQTLVYILIEGLK